MITIVHQYDIEFDRHVGGIDTWISDYLELSKQVVRVVGVSDSIGMVMDRHELYSIMIRKKKRKIPISILFLISILKNRRVISNEIYVHRIDFVPFLRLIRPRSRITLFIHTDSKMQISKVSDSFWRYVPYLYLIFERLSLFLSSNVFVYSQTDAPRINRICSSSTLLKSWYNDIKFKEFGIPRNNDICLWIGRFEKPKDPILAIKSFAIALERDSNLRLRMIGEGKLVPEMNSEIQNCGLSDKIQIISPETQNQLAFEMNSSGVLLHTSEFEGSPRILVEALACGLRIVSNPMADPDQLSATFGLCSATRLPEDVATALLNVRRISLKHAELEMFLSQVAGSRIVGRLF